MTIDYSTAVGKLRMRLGDVSDLPFLSDAIYSAVYTEEGSNLNRAVVTCGTMILAQLSYKAHRKMGLQLEIWGKEMFDSYKEFLLLTVSNPAFMTFSPIPAGTTDEFNTLVQFQSDWNKNYFSGTQSQQLASDGLASANQGGLYGPTSDSSRWAD